MKTNKSNISKPTIIMLTQERKNLRIYTYTYTYIYIYICICAFVSVLGVSSKLKNIKSSLKKTNLYNKDESFIKNEYLLESWDDGEVAWDLEPFHYSSNEKINKKIKIDTIHSKNRDKIWGLLEELRINGVISGILNVAYYNTAVSENIINDLQNFDFKPNDSLSNTITKNYSGELDIIFTILTILAYKKYQEERIPTFIQKWDSNKNSYKNIYIDEYRKIRRITTIIMLTIIVVFCKSVKNAT